MSASGQSLAIFCCCVIHKHKAREKCFVNDKIIKQIERIALEWREGGKFLLHMLIARDQGSDFDEVQMSPSFMLGEVKR